MALPGAAYKCAGIGGQRCMFSLIWLVLYANLARHDKILGVEPGRVLYANLARHERILSVEPGRGATPHIGADWPNKEQG